MAGLEWETTFTHFQAHARGHLVRKEINSVCSVFEDIVRELDGETHHLAWEEGVLPTPHFIESDTDNLLQALGSFVRKPVTAGPDVGASRAEQEAASRQPETRIEAERDGALSQGQTLLCRISSCPPGGGGETESSLREAGEGRRLDTISACNVELDGSYRHFQRGLLQRCLAQDAAHTPDALRLHRNTIAMELLWLQQAITSRKKYLLLKERLDVS